MLRGLLREPFAQQPVSADTTGDDELGQSGFFQRRQRFCHQHIHGGCLKLCREIGLVLRRQIFAAYSGEYGGFKAAETEVEVSAVEHRARQRKAARRPAFGECGDVRPAGIAQTQ